MTLGISIMKKVKSYPVCGKREKCDAINFVDSLIKKSVGEEYITFKSMHYQNIILGLILLIIVSERILIILLNNPHFSLVISYQLHFVTIFIS